ncbi:MAG: PrsW family intramembrane metalloprotease [Pyrinomonadaceae bacterium]
MNDLLGGNFAPGVIQSNRGSQTVIKLMIGFAVVLVTLLLGLLVLLIIGIGTGPVALLIGFVLATLPVPIYVTLALWIDRYESEPLWLLAGAFLWGAIVAPFVAFILNTFSSVVVALLFGERAGEVFGSVVSAPIVEESAKGIFLFGIFFFKRDEFDGVIDGIVYAAMVALGFAMTENIQYYGQSAIKGAGMISLTFILRGVLAPYAHPLFTSMTGIGLGLASQTRNKFVKFFIPLVGFATAMFFHALWNLSAEINGSAYFAVYFLIMVPVFITVLVAIVFALRREGRTVREQLLCDVQRGDLSAADYECLCTVRGRIGASYQALTRGGVKTWRARMQYNNIASELAFHRARVAKGLTTNAATAAAREAAYAKLLSDLRKRVIIHNL